MANTAQARKRARQSVERNKHNSSLRSMLRTAIKRVRQSIAVGDKSAAGVVFQKASRSEEHTSELQSLMRNSYAVFCLKKKKTKTNKSSNTQTQVIYTTKK